MIKGVFSRFSASTQLLLFGFIILFSFTLVIVITFVSGGANGDVINVKNLTSEDILKYKYLQILQSVFLFLVPSLLGAYVFSKQGIKHFFSLKKQPFSTYFLAFLLVGFSIPVMNALGYFNSQISLPDYFQWMYQSEKEAGLLTEVFLKADSIRDLSLNLFVIAFLPALGEELLFRGVVQKLLQKTTNNPHIAIWITAFVFSAIHFQFLTFLPRFMMGAILGYLFFWSGNILVPILAHFVNNGLAVLLSYLIQNNMISDGFDMLGAGTDYLFLTLSCVVFSGVCFYIIYRKAYRANAHFFS